MRKSIYIAILFLLSWLCIPISYASHIVGGEITYKYLGNNWYRIYVSIYEDCLTGSPDAIAQDNPAYIKIFKGNLTSLNNTPFYPPNYTETDSIFCNFHNIDSNFQVPTNFSNDCIKNPPATCLRKKTFVRDYNLPPDPKGYIVVYQRCCRNASILNIANPSSIGATYYCLIPASTVSNVYNNSAVFKNYPPQIICINQPIFYDHSATDPDGDSLSYEFCNTYAGGNDTDSKPVPTPPPFQNVTFLNPFSTTDPMGGYPQIQIDPHSGLITGTPKMLGRFVVTVCCHEWRNHALINTVKREFQFVVTNCSKAVVADIPILTDQPNVYLIDCMDYTINFLNTSTGGFAYNWYFGDIVSSDTSTDFQPTYTYHDTGSFLVRLIVNKGSTCPDSIARIVKVYPKFTSDFKVSGVQCPGSPLQFTDLTSATYKPINFWEYRFGDGDTAFQANPIHTYNQGGNYYVTFISTNTKGCSDTAVKEILVERFKPFAGDDTVIVQNEYINFDASGGNKFYWTAGNDVTHIGILNNDTIGNPIGTFNDTGKFQLNLHVVSPLGCIGDTTIRIQVVPYAEFFMPTAFTPNGDGLNDYFHPIHAGYRSLTNFRIYDRWGELVFDTHDWLPGWDGKKGSALLPMGVYFWEITTINRYGKEESFKGDVTLIR